MSFGNKDVEVLVTIVTIGDLHMIVNDGDRDANLPLSQITYDEDAVEGDEIEITLPEWLAMRTELI